MLPKVVMSQTDKRAKLQELENISNPPKEVREAINELRTLIGEEEAEATAQYQATLREDAPAEEKK